MENCILREDELNFNKIVMDLQKSDRICYQFASKLLKHFAIWDRID